MKYRPLKWYLKYKWPRKVRYYSRQVMTVIGITLIGFFIGTFYPNFISQNSLEERAVDKTIKWAKEIGFREPTILTHNDDEFILTMTKCIDYLNLEIHQWTGKFFFISLFIFIGGLFFDLFNIGLIPAFDCIERYDYLRNYANPFHKFLIKYLPIISFLIVVEPMIDNFLLNI